MGDIIGLVSGKGGVGKTTITACLGAVLSKQGHRVLLCDGDFGLRDLDLVLGKNDEVCFDAYDAINDAELTEDVIIEIKDNLFFLPASQQMRWEDMGRKKYRKFVQRLSEQYDYILVDAPAGIGRGLESIMKLANRFLVITQPLWVSLRNAARMIQFCRDYSHRDYVVVFNSLHPAPSDLNLYDMLDAIGAEYVGAILPYEEGIVEFTQEGRLAEVMPQKYEALLKPLVDYIVTGDAWDEQDVVNQYDTITAVKEVELQPTLASPQVGEGDVIYTSHWSTQSRLVEGKQSLWRRKGLK